MTWKRVEGGSIDPQMTEGMSARVADPLWLLARQWQVGEFRGEDAASPILMEASLYSVPVVDFRLDAESGSRVVPRTQSGIPIETLAEQEPVTAGPAAQFMRLESGAALLRALALAKLPGSLLDTLRRAYAFTDSIEDSLDAVGAARLRLLALRAPDGARIKEAIAAAGGDPMALPELASLAEGSRAAIVILAWLKQEDALFRDIDPAAVRAWSPERLDYAFKLGVRVPGQKIELSAPEYPGGHLDWHAFDLSSESKESTTRVPGMVVKKLRSLAMPLQLAGMPASRWWEFEDGDVDFGDLAAGPEDLARSVIAAYVVVAGDDWFLLPCTLPASSLCRVKELSVLDDFGVRTKIPATAVRDSGAPSRPWRWFELTGDPGPERGESPLLFLPPVVNAVEQGRPLEAVEFRRDELANLAWAIEQRVESSAGRPVDREAGHPSGTEPAQDSTLWRYQLATDVPDNWVPLVPVRITSASPQVVLRRGTVAAAADPTAHRAKGRILEPEEVFLLREEVIPSGGVRVTRRFQMARSADGDVHVWIGREKRPSGGPMRRTPLRFDMLSGWKRRAP